MRSTSRVLIPVLIAALLVASVGMGCTSAGARGEALAAKISAGLADPNPLTRQAWSMIQSDIEHNEAASREIFADKATSFTDAEITTLELANRFDRMDESGAIEVYRLRYRTLPKDLSKIMLAGGMDARDGWLLSVGSMGNPYLVAREAAGARTCIGTIYPDGEGQGVLNATLELLYRLEAQNGGSVAASPIEIRRVYAVTNPDLTPKEAAELLTLCFVESLRESEDIENPKYKTFVLTDYKDLSFKMYPTTAAPAEYRLQSGEISGQTWIVEPSVAYRYQGTISPIGDGKSIPTGQWATQLYQGSRVGFLMTKDGDSYTFRSRYFTQHRDDGTVPDTANDAEDTVNASGVRFADFPSGADFVESVIDGRGSVAITDEMRERFDLFARDYRLICMPDMDGYESFFDSTGYAGSFGYPNFADAVFYVLQYMGYPEKMSEKAMQDAIQTLFVTKGSYRDMPHQAYRKFADYQDGYYSPWPEGALDHDRMFYLLTAVSVEQNEDQDVYITVRATSYYFSDSSVYEAGENEKWLSDKSKELGISELQAASKLIMSGAMEEITGERRFETTIYIQAGGPRGLSPRFAANRSLETGK